MTWVVEFNNKTPFSLKLKINLTSVLEKGEKEGIVVEEKEAIREDSCGREGGSSGGEGRREGINPHKKNFK